MHDDIPNEGDTEFQREMYRTKLARQHEIAMIRIRNKHELRTLRLGHAHKAEIARTVGSELRDTLGLYSDGLMKFCAFVGPDLTAHLVGDITDRTALAMERIADAYFAGPSCTGTCHAEPGARDLKSERDCDGCDGCAPETDDEREEFQRDLASGCGWGDEDPEDGSEDGSEDDEDNEDGEDAEDDDADTRATKRRWTSLDFLNLLELRGGVLSHPVLGEISGLDALASTLPNMDVHVEARSLPDLDENGPLRWLDPVALEDLETWKPLAEYVIRGGHLIGRDGVTTIDAELARFQDCLLRVSTRPASAPSDVAVSPENDIPTPASGNADQDSDEDDLGNDQASAVEDLQALCAESAPAFTTGDEVRTKGFGGPPDRD